MEKDAILKEIENRIEMILDCRITSDRYVENPPCYIEAMDAYFDLIENIQYFKKLIIKIKKEKIKTLWVICIDGARKDECFLYEGSEKDIVALINELNENVHPAYRYYSKNAKDLFTDTILRLIGSTTKEKGV